jgi:hypothetical protein
LVEAIETHLESGEWTEPCEGKEDLRIDAIEDIIYTLELIF